MIDNDVHRVYVYVPEAKPAVVGVVTPTDILRLFLRLGLGASSTCGGGAGRVVGVGPAGVAGVAGVLARPAGAPAHLKKARVDAAA
jgi:hypothetical protein